MLLQSMITGLLLGGIYAAYSAGFSLIFGVMRVVKTSQIVQPFTRMTVAENILVGAMYGGG